MQEILIPLAKLPPILYHIVPIDLFKKFQNYKGNYDPRNKKEFGGERPYIHTTPTISQINDHLEYLNTLPNDQPFYLLKIDIKKLNPPKITYVNYDGIIFHHLWCELPTGTYELHTVQKYKNGKIDL